MPCLANNTPGSGARRAALEQTIEDALVDLPIRDYCILVEPQKERWQVLVMFTDGRRRVSALVPQESQPLDATTKRASLPLPRP
jgi:hypothetical protein